MDTITDEIRRCVYFSYIQFVGKANELYFPVAIEVTDANPKAKATFDTNIFKITYQLDKKSYRDKFKTLMRKQETFLQSLNPSRVKPAEFAPGISLLEFLYPYRKPEEELIGIEGQAELVWLDEWKVKDRIPMAVKIKIAVAVDPNDADSEQITFERTVFIPQGTLETEPVEDDETP